ncbi:MAG: hypothetical protein N2Z62_06915 [Rhodobacteraceae bacterium]|nr:hypothetical protein [Paracoccaceae bacterium]
MAKVAVLTGDLVGSTEAGPAAVEDSFACLASAADEIGRWAPDLPPRLTRFRGDGWQLMTQAALGLRAALYVLARLRAAAALGTRIAIGIGEAAQDAAADPAADLAAARGTAFEASGRALDALPRHRTLAVAGAGLTLLHPVVADLLAAHARRWTLPQAEAAALYLHPDNPTLTDIAPRLGITPQAVNYRLAGGALPTIRAALRGWEHAFERWEANGSWNP